MQQFFTDPSGIRDGRIYIEGQDVSHMKNVLRMRPGETVKVSDGMGKSYLCSIEGYEEGRAELKIEKKKNRELEVEIAVLKKLKELERRGL